MEATLISAAIAIIVFIAFQLLFPKRISSDEKKRQNTVLQQMSQEAGRNNAQYSNDVSLLKERAAILPTSGASGVFAKLPGVRSTFDLILKAGLGQKRGAFLLCVYGLCFVLILLLYRMGPGGILLSLVLTYVLMRKYLTRRIDKRNQQFLNLFPDAVDMIVRSVRSGHPLNMAMRMIAENMENPIREEFKQVVDEVSYGRTLTEALSRMATRIGEQDLQFFVVVLSVQQETGGSLAEVLTNLSGVIRKRRQLRLKIRALTSEGRATSYILGALPVLEFGALYYTNPTYLDPLFVTSTGHIILGAAISLIVGAMWIVRAMINIDI